MNTKTQRLWCEKGEHYWNRPSKRGVKPKNCDKHPVVPTPPPGKATLVADVLTCKAGHTWERPPSRGKKPQWCPEHHPANREKPKVKKTETTRGTVIDLDQLRGQLGGRSTGPVGEALRVLDYINAQIRSGRTDGIGEGNYWTQLGKTQALWLRRIELDTSTHIDPALLVVAA